MKKILKTVIFFGNERLATAVGTSTPTLNALVQSGYNVAAIVTNNSPANSRSNRKLEVEEFATDHNIPLLMPKRILEIQNQLKEYNATIGILVAYGKIVPQEIIDLFPNGIINIHPSLLPLHRGPSPIESVILDGSISTGVSIMKLVKAMDAGPVYIQNHLKLNRKETKQELADTLAAMGAKMIIEILPKIISGDVAAKPQKEIGVSYDSLITKDAGRIDWKKPAKIIEREIRAFIGWPGSHTTLGDKDIIITKAHILIDSGNPGTYYFDNKQLTFYTGKGALAIEKLKPAGKTEMNIKQFLAGYSYLLKK